LKGRAVAFRPERKLFSIGKVTGISFFIYLMCSSLKENVKKSEGVPS